jgi:hypothetical protein
MRFFDQSYSSDKVFGAT